MVWCTGTVIVLVLCLTSVRGEIGVRFEEWPKWKILAPGGETELSCRTNFPTNRIVWLYDHHVYLNSTDVGTNASPEEQTFFITGDKRSSVLHIRLHHNPDDYKKQLGLYQCVAWLGSTAVTSLPGRIDVATLKDFSGTSGNINLTVPEGEPARIFCPLPESNPPAELTFYKDGQLLDTSDTGVYWVDQSGDLILRSASQTQIGTYVCSAYNTVLAKSVTSSHYTDVTVVKPWVYKQEPKYELVSIQETYVLKSGQKAEIGCLVSGSKGGEIKWKRDNGDIPESAEYLMDGTLVLPELQVSFSDTYNCSILEDEIERQLDSISLIVQEAPTVQLETDMTTVAEGSNITIDCYTTGSPAPTVIWVFNGGLPANDISINKDEKSLFIYPVEKKHAGVYQCFAYNILGAAQGTTMINVMPKMVTQSNGVGGRTKQRKRLQKNKSDSKTPAKERLIPPPRPRITKESDISVLVSWDHQNSSLGMPVSFYKVQYKIVGKNSKALNKWQTIDDDILPHLNSYVITDLQAGNSYKFRLAAVYINDSSLHGPTSKRFALKKGKFHFDTPDRPVLTKMNTSSRSKVTLKWDYQSNITTEGFFILYRDSTKAVDYYRLRINGESTRSYTVRNLSPTTSYDFRVQSFNLAGTSKPSNLMSRIVKSVSLPDSTPHNYSVDTTSRPSFPRVLSESYQVSNFHLYLILGLVIGSLVLIVLVSFTVYSCRHKNCEEPDPRSYSPCMLTDDHYDLKVKSVSYPHHPHPHHAYEGTTFTTIT